MSPVVLALIVLVAVGVVVSAFRLDERRHRTGRGLWAALRDLRPPPTEVAPPPGAGTRSRLARAGSLSTIVPVLLLAAGLVAAAWWLSDESGAPDPGAPDAAADLDGETPGDEMEEAAPPAAPSDDGTAVQQAVAFSQQIFPDGDAEHVVLARSQPSVDALAAGGLQGVLGGPLLLTDPDELPPVTAEEIDRLGTPSVHILGGEEAVSSDIEESLVAAGHDVHRHAGPTGMDTAIDVAAEHLPDAEAAILAPTTAASSADVLVRALTTGALAAAEQIPILLTSGDALNASTGAHLVESPITSVYVLGTEDEISASVIGQLEALGLEVTRFGDTDRYITAAALSQSQVYTAGETPAVLLADGSDERLWPGLSVAAVYAGRQDAPLLLSEGETLPEATRGALEQVAPDSRIVCLPGVVEDACAAARAVLQP